MHQQVAISRAARFDLASQKLLCFRPPLSLEELPERLEVHLWHVRIRLTITRSAAARKRRPLQRAVGRRLAERLRQLWVLRYHDKGIASSAGLPPDCPRAAPWRARCRSSKKKPIKDTPSA